MTRGSAGDENEVLLKEVLLKEVLQRAEAAMKEIHNHKTHELTEDDLNAVTGGAAMIVYPLMPAAMATSEPEPKQPTTYGEAFNALIIAAGGTPR